MICALCQKNEADKKNTHYLTDSIIRSCLNYDGGNERETGFYYDISSSKLFIDFNFQHDTSVGAIEEELGRSATDEEIEKAKAVPFAVDYVFCKKCEGMFSDIEDKFASKYLPQFRNSNSAIGNQLHFDDTTTFRLFFLMQVWRTHICTEKFKISASTSEKLRTLILTPDEALLKEFPLSVTYLTTSGDQFEYTKNFVGFATGHTPNIIFMNDFTIQFYDEINSVRKCLPLYGINRPSTFRYFLNYQEKEFIVKIMSDKERKEILTHAVIEFKVTPLLDTLRQAFIEYWIKKFGTPPTFSLIQSYIDGVIDWHNLPQVQRLSKDRIMQYTKDFFNKHTAI